MTPTDRAGDATRELFRQYRQSRDRALRNRLVEQNLSLADYPVHKHRRKGIPEDDLRQLAMLAIMHAVERYDPDYGVSFATFASRTIEGELRHYFRDRTWSVRPPRALQELHLRIRSADEELTQRNGAAPSLSAIAEYLDVDVDDVLEGLEAGASHQSVSLDAGPTGVDEVPALAPRLPVTADRTAEVDQRLLTEEMLAGLSPRDREAVYLRYFENMSQSEIAERIGVSQSYLSRVLRSALLQMRAGLEA